MDCDGPPEVGPVLGRRDQLLESTLTAMQRGGLDAVTLDSVVAEVGVSPESVRFLFGSFDNLLGEALEELRVRRHERSGRMLAALPPVGSPFADWERSVDVLARGLIWLSADGDFSFWELCEQATHRPELADIAADSMVALQDQLAQLLLDCGVPAGDQLAPVLYGLVHGVVSYHRITGDDHDAMVADLAHALRALTTGHVQLVSGDAAEDSAGPQADPAAGELDPV